MDYKKVVLILWLAGCVSAYNASVEYPLNSTAGVFYDEAILQENSMIVSANSFTSNLVWLFLMLIVLSVVYYLVKRYTRWLS